MGFNNKKQFIISSSCSVGISVLICICLLTLLFKLVEGSNNSNNTTLSSLNNKGNYTDEELLGLGLVFLIGAPIFLVFVFVLCFLMFVLCIIGVAFLPLLIVGGIIGFILFIAGGIIGLTIFIFGGTMFLITFGSFYQVCYDSLVSPFRAFWNNFRISVTNIRRSFASPTTLSTNINDWFENNPCTPCAICLEVIIRQDADADAEEGIRILPCCHGFHEDCINTWLSTANSRDVCPICQRQVH